MEKSGNSIVAPRNGRFVGVTAASANGPSASDEKLARANVAYASPPEHMTAQLPASLE